MKCQAFLFHSYFFLEELDISVMAATEYSDVIPLIETQHHHRLTG